MTEQVFGTTPVQQTTNPAVAPVAQPAPVAPAPVAPDPISVYDNLAARVTNPDGSRKYASVSDALNALPHAQQKITELQAEVKRLTEELSKRVSVEEQLQQMRSQSQAPVEPQATPVKEQDLAELVAAQIEKLEGKKAAQTNTEMVREKLNTAFGEKAGEVWAAKAAELGVSTNFLDDMAAKSPQALFKMLGLDGNVRPQQSSFLQSTHVTPSDPVRNPYTFDKPLHRMSGKEKTSAWASIAAEVNARHNGQ